MQRPPVTDELHCPHCGYNVSDIPTRRCPECGGTFDRAWLRRNALSTPSFGRLAVPVALSAWIVFTIWALGQMAAIVMLPAAAGLALIICMATSLALAGGVARAVQQRGIAREMSPRALASAAFAACLATQLAILAGAASLAIMILW